MHGNVSKRLVEVADITMVWRTNPHLDAKPRSRKCAELLYRTVRGEIRPVQWIETPPLVVNIVRQFTGEEPMKTLVEDCVAANERPNILDTSVAEGYPYADVEEMGMSWIAIADGDLDAAREAAVWMADAGVGASSGAQHAGRLDPRRHSRRPSGGIGVRGRSAMSTRCRPTGRRWPRRRRVPRKARRRVSARSC